MRKTSTPVLLSIFLLDHLDQALRHAESHVKSRHAEFKAYRKRLRGTLYDRLLDQAEEMPWAQWVRDNPPGPGATDAEMDKIEADWRSRPRYRPRGWHGLTW